VNTTDVYAADRAARMLREYAARELAAELGCEVEPSQGGKVEARGRGWLLIGTPAEVRAEVLRMQEQEQEQERQRERRRQLLEWLDVLGTQGGPA
jgi:alkanesulfonate monooxygenase SsuD/methylene tetrahydromethanopterin reductase-like flavin-dependent oxidoreductase (luciferase family)